MTRQVINPLSTRLTMSWQIGLLRCARRPRPALRLARRSAGVAPHRPGRHAVAAQLGIPRSLRAPARPDQAIRAGEALVPNLIGSSWESARALLHHLHLVAVAPDPDGPPLAELGWPDGVVVDQHPEPGTVVPAGSPVTLWIERGPGSSGVREPRRPKPAPKSMRGMVDESTGETID
jgi:hypothetical protein